MDYHYTDQNNPEHEILYGKEINKYAEIAHQIDPQSDLSLIAKALYWRNEKEYEMAIDFLEDALDYNPNSYQAISNLYALYRYTENKEKSVEYALKIINSNLQIESTNKELGIERIYTQLSNQYRLLGFPDKALIYINEAIRINPNYTTASIIKSEIIADKEGNYQKSKDILERVINMDSTSINTLYRLGQWYYMLRDYTNANTIYNKWFELSGNNVKDYYGLRSRRLAFVYREMGEMEKAQIQINNYRAFGESINVAGRSFLLTGFYAFMNDTTNAIEQLKIASKYDHYYFRIRQLKDEPIYDNIRELPEFQQILSEMETRFNERRDSIRVVFEKKRLL
jgi:tetratricopeptide (TPR) repeat protein